MPKRATVAGGEVRAGYGHERSAHDAPLLWGHMLHRWERNRRDSLQTLARRVAPLLLVAIEVAVEHLVVLGAAPDFSKRSSVFRRFVEGPTFVADLVACRPKPRVELRVGDRLAVLVGHASEQRVRCPVQP